MKYAIVIPDGCADEPQRTLGGQTPLQAAITPNMDRIASIGVVGASNNTPASLIPASDVATLSLFGYDPLEVYTGRAPLEAAAMNLELGPHDWAIRCNLVTARNGIMEDFSGGHVTTADGRRYMQTIAENLCSPELAFHAGVSYRNILLYRANESAPAPFGADTETQPPHDIADQPVEGYLPKGPGSELLRELMQKSQQLLAGHPTNQQRQARGELPVTQIWLWGQGQRPNLELFEEKFGKRCAIITAVDLLRGVGKFLGWDRIEVPGATGYLDTDYSAKAAAGIAALDDYDLVCVHVEAPDEASHEGRVDAKIEALEQIDRHIVGPMTEAIETFSDWRLLVSPDHPTPVRTRAHGRGLVPWAVAGTGVESSGARYSEADAERSQMRFDPGHLLMPWFLAS